MTTEPRHLSKARVLAGQQCARRLWLASFAPELASPMDPGRREIVDIANEIGTRARELFPGGVAVGAAHFDQAVVRTRALLADAAVPAVFDAAFLHDGVRIRVHVVERLHGGAWGLRGVKSTARVKSRHLDDLAVQRYVLAGAGLEVPSVELIHVDGRYVRGDDLDWRLLFKRADVTAAVAKRATGLALTVEELRRHVASTTPPVVEPSKHCWTPTACDFWAHCTRDKPADWIHYLPRTRAEVMDALRVAGIARIVDIPDDVELGTVAARIRDVLRSGRSFVSPTLAAALAALGPPAFYLDFETMNATIPLYPGSRPFEQIPFQWSLHRVDANGTVVHRELLADGRRDPRRAVAEALVDAVGGSQEPIVVYSDFESMVLDDLASKLVDLAPALQAIRARLRDLGPIVQTHLYHPAFQYSFSLKSVAPALVAGFSYDDLAGVADGGTAARAFARIAAGRCDAAEEARIRRALLAYCERDTRALVEIHHVLRDGPSPPR